MTCGDWAVCHSSYSVVSNGVCKIVVEWGVCDEDEDVLLLFLSLFAILFFISPLCTGNTLDKARMKLD